MSCEAPPSTATSDPRPCSTAPQPLQDNVSSRVGSGERPQKKRKYEEANPVEKTELYNYYVSSPHLKQRELAEWFKNKYGKPINQSTVSRILKKMKECTTASGTVLAQVPRKRAKLPTSLQVSSPQQQHNPVTGTTTFPLPPTPPPREILPSKIDHALLDYYNRLVRENGRASDSEIRTALKQEAQRLHAGIRPPPPPERIDEQVVDEMWIADWLRRYVPKPPPSPTSFTGQPSPNLPLPGSGAVGETGSQLRLYSSETRTSSEDTEPRSPVSAFSSSEAECAQHETRALALAGATTEDHPQVRFVRTPRSHSPDKSRKIRMKQLRREIAKREERIQRESIHKSEAERELQELEREEQIDIKPQMSA